jgi:hypothetical protein
VQVVDVCIARDQDVEQSPEWSDHGAVEGHMAHSLEPCVAERTSDIVDGEDGLAEEDVARVHPRLRQQPSEKLHLRRRTADPDEVRRRGGNAPNRKSL